jgi:hypothetical protein
MIYPLCICTMRILLCDTIVKTNKLHTWSLVNNIVQLSSKVDKLSDKVDKGSQSYRSQWLLCSG